MEPIHLTKQQIDLLFLMREHKGKTFTHQELVELGYSLTEDNYRNLCKCVRRQGYNHFNYTYQITDWGISYCEEYESLQEKTADEKAYQTETLLTAKEANEIAKQANRKSRNANIISWGSALFAFLSAVAAIITLCLKLH